jgi:hypothetical protein
MRPFIPLANGRRQQPKIARPRHWILWQWRRHVCLLVLVWKREQVSSSLGSKPVRSRGKSAAASSRNSSGGETPKWIILTRSATAGRTISRICGSSRPGEFILAGDFVG